MLFDRKNQYYQAKTLRLSRRVQNRVREWCEANHLCTQTYYRWQRRLFEMAQAQQEVRFAEVTPVTAPHFGSIAVTVRISGSEADIHSGADAAIVETVLQI